MLVNFALLCPQFDSAIAGQSNNKYSNNNNKKNNNKNRRMGKNTRERTDNVHLCVPASHDLREGVWFDFIWFCCWGTWLWLWEGGCWSHGDALLCCVLCESSCVWCFCLDEWGCGSFCLWLLQEGNECGVWMNGQAWCWGLCVWGYQGGDCVWILWKVKGCYAQRRRWDVTCN